MVQYRRKFLVPGETPRVGRYSRELCSELCGAPFLVAPPFGPNPNRINAPCVKGYLWGKPDYSKCRHPEKMFNQYLVGKTETGTWTCSCKAWTTTVPRKDCKHIKKARRNPQRYEVPSGFTERAIKAVKRLDTQEGK